MTYSQFDPAAQSCVPWNFEAFRADRGYDADAIREEIEAAGGEAVIPTKVNPRNRARHDRAKYKWGNLIERLFNKRKNWRRIATRYDKTKESYLGFSHSPQTNPEYPLATKASYAFHCLGLAGTFFKNHGYCSQKESFMAIGLKSSLLVVAACIVSGAVYAQTAENQRSQPQASIQEQTEQFLASKRSSQRAMIADLRDQGINFGQVQSLTSRFKNLLRANDRVEGTSLAEEVNEVFLNEVAIELAVLGFGPQNLRPQDNPERIFLAAANKLRGAATPGDFELLSENVVTGRVVNYEVENENSASQIFMVVEVERSLKGDIAPSSRIKIPLQSRMSSANTFERISEETIPGPGAEITAYLSRSAANRSNRRVSANASNDVYAKITNVVAGPAA